MALIDWDQFEDNFSYYDKETIREVIESYLEEYEERIKALEQYLAKRELSQLSFHAHSLKSVIGNFMAAEPYELCRKIEFHAKEGETEELPALLESLKIKINELNRELKEYLQT